MIPNTIAEIEELIKYNASEIENFKKAINVREQRIKEWQNQSLQLEALNKNGTPNKSFVMYKGEKRMVVGCTFDEYRKPSEKKIEKLILASISSKGEIQKRTCKADPFDCVKI